MLHRMRELLVKQRTMLVNSLRGPLAKFGPIPPKRNVEHRLFIRRMERDRCSTIGRITMGYLYFDESIQERGEFIVGAFVYSD